MFGMLAKSRCVFIVGVFGALSISCDVITPPTGGGPDDGGPDGVTTPFTVVKTGIDVRHDKAIRAGDDLVAFGTGATTGVSYIIPSTNPTTETAVPDASEYNSGAFAVGGKNVFLVGSNTGSLAFQVSVFDSETGTIVHTFPTSDVRLGTIPASEEDVGNIQADGDFCVVICDQNTVTDGKIIKVIDASSNPPTLIAFGVNPASSHFGVDQADVDAATRRVVAVADDTFFIYNMDGPNLGPIQIAAPNGVGDVQMEIAGDFILAIDNQAPGEAFLVDIVGQTIVPLTNPEATWDVSLCNDGFAFFADATLDDRAGGGQRVAVGTMPGPDSTKAAMNQYIDGSTVNNGLVGYGGSLSMTPGGEYVFLSDGYLQYSGGDAAFVVIPDPDASDVYGTPAWDVHCSANTVAFKTASDRSADTNTKVGYIVLP